MRDGSRRGGSLRIGASGLPNVDNFDYEHTSTRQTETDVIAPISSRANARPTISVVVGADAGKLLRITREETVIGRATSCHLVLPDPGVSRQHARIVRSGERFFIEDLGSKNGTFVDVESVAPRRHLEYGDPIQIGPHVLLRFAHMTEAEERLSRDLYDSSMRDALTQTYNRRYFFDRLATELAFAIRHRTQLAVVLLDLDHFKRVNDTYGHPAGDAVLRQAAYRILRTIRAEDVAARVGGEEFAVLIRGSGVREATLCAERIRNAMSSQTMTAESFAIDVTASLGVAALSDCDGASAVTPEALFSIADRRLYAAKGAGRNRVSNAG